MPYVRGYTPESEAPEPALAGYLRRDGGAEMIAVRYGRTFRRPVPPNGLVSLAEAAALLHRRDADTGELRPFSRIAVYEWARSGKLPTVSEPRRAGTRPVVQVKLSELRRYARANGYEFRPLDEAAGR